ncbi:MAG: hypothetical protein H8E15_12110 [Planctomycetes bacterium]|nr:hypothetical protein [Planctomycetota bacterium]
MANKISGGRKTAYYLGGIISLIGLLTFLSIFISTAMNFGDFDNFDSDASSFILRGVLGMLMIIIGSVIRGIGARGLAGSGVILDPEKAREELKPYSRMAGGMVKDVLEEADINLGRGGGEPQKVVVVKCRACGFLNEEDSKFCQDCGDRM